MIGSNWNYSKFQIILISFFLHWYLLDPVGSFPLVVQKYYSNPLNFNKFGGLYKDWNGSDFDKKFFIDVSFLSF